MKPSKPAPLGEGRSIEVDTATALAASQALRQLIQVPMNPLVALRIAGYTKVFDAALTAYDLARKNQLERFKVNGVYPGARDHPNAVAFDLALGDILKQKHRISVPAKPFKLAELGLAEEQTLTPAMLLGLEWLIEE